MENSLYDLIFRGWPRGSLGRGRGRRRGRWRGRPAGELPIAFLAGEPDPGLVALLVRGEFDRLVVAPAEMEQVRRLHLPVLQLRQPFADLLLRRPTVLLQGTGLGPELHHRCRGQAPRLKVFLSFSAAYQLVASRMPCPLAVLVLPGVLGALGLGIRLGFPRAHLGHDQQPQLLRWARRSPRNASRASPRRGSSSCGAPQAPQNHPRRSSSRSWPGPRRGSLGAGHHGLQLQDELQQLRHFRLIVSWLSSARQARRAPRP